jgi:hypothetical protein
MLEAPAKRYCCFAYEKNNLCRFLARLVLNFNLKYTRLVILPVYVCVQGTVWGQQLWWLNSRLCAFLLGLQYSVWISANLFQFI